MVRVTTICLIALLAGACLVWNPAAADGQPQKAKAGAKPATTSCGSCHKAEQAIWGNAAHARAGLDLNAAQRKDASCMQCHAPSGDPARGVDCSTCHGDSFSCGDWREAVHAGRRTPTEKTCWSCHAPSKAHPESNFEFPVDYEDIRHDRAGKADRYTPDGIYRRFETYTVADGLPDQKVFCVKVVGDDVWAGTERGLALFRDGKWKSWGVKDGLVHPAVSSLDYDPKTHELFAGTLGGVSIFDGKRFQTLTEKTVGLVNNCVFGVTLKDDDLWVATFDGISRYDRRKGTCTNYRLDEAPLEEVWIYGCEAARDRVDFAVWGGGLVEYYPRYDHWQAYHDPDGSFELDLFRNDGVTSMMTTAVSRANGRTWIGSYFGTSVYDGRSWQEYNEDDSGLASNFINFIKTRGFEGWHCTDKGLSVLDYRRGRWVTYRRLEGSGPAHTEIRITGVDGEAPRRFFCTSAFPYDFVWGVDFQGLDLWIATSKGLARASYGGAADKLYPIESVLPPAAAANTPEPVVAAAAGADNRKPIGLVPAGSLGNGFAQEVLSPEYTQPYVFFKKPHAVPLSKDYSRFVDPVGREDESFENEPEVRVGFLGCLSGPAKSYSGEMLNGARMAVKEINAAGGYHGKPVVLKTRDDKARMGLTADQTVKLIFDDKVLAFLGSMSSDTTHVALRVALKGEVPELTSISTDPTITQLVIPWIFRCLADDWSQGRALAKLIFLDRKFTKVALLERNNRYGRMGSAEIKRVAKRMGHPITLAIKYGKSTKTFKDHIRKIKEYGAQALVVWGLYYKGAQLVREMKEEGLDIPVFGSDGLVSQKFIDLAGDAAEGVVVTYPYDFYRDDPVTRSFNKRFKEIYGHDPDSFAAHGYDAMYIVWNAIKRAGLNRTRIRDELAKTKDFHGVTGMISFDHRGNDMRGVSFAVVHDGKFLPLRMAGRYVRKGLHEK